MTSSESSERISIWLIPCDEHKLLLSNIIVELAQKLEFPVFEPHVTVFSGKTSFGLAEQSLDYAGNNFKQISLETGKIKTEPVLTKTLYISLKETEELLCLSRSLSTYFLSSSFAFDPHLSLAYKKLPRLVRESLIRETSTIMSEVRFSYLRAIHTPAPTISENDVEKWRMICSKKLNWT